MKIVLLGSGGQLGSELGRTLPSIADDVLTFNRQELDISHREALAAVLHRTRPDVIVNAAAYTDVEKTESEPEKAKLANAIAPGNIASIASEIGAAVVHYSTDYVFNGSLQRPYKETDEAKPLNTYARTKLDGERALQASGAPYLIMRVSWVYGGLGRSFVASLLRRAERGEILNVVDDQVGVPTWVRRIVLVTGEILRQASLSGNVAQSLATVSGIYHCAPHGEVTRADLAEEVLRLGEYDPARIMRRIPTSAFPSAAVRPKYSVLDPAKLKTTFGIEMPHWKADLQQAIPEIMAALEQERACK